MRNLALILLLFSANLWSAEAVESNFYAGGALGFAELNEDGMAYHLKSFDNNSATVHIFGGYQFNPYFSAELAIDSLGFYQGETKTADIDNSYSSLTFSLLGRMPLGGGFSVFAQGGGGVASIYQVVDGVIPPYYYDDDDTSSSGFATVWGAGLSFLVPDHNAIEIRAGYLRTNFEVDAVTVNGPGKLIKEEYDQSIKQFYVGAAYHF